MFRYVTDLKALAIDAESFPNIEISRWRALYNQFRCLFIISNEDMRAKIRAVYPDCLTYLMEEYLRVFAPNRETHVSILDLLEVEATEMAYLSGDIDFLGNALNFLGGTIWVTDSVRYTDARIAPDLICHDLTTAENRLIGNMTGFLGERTLYPGSDRGGVVIPVRFAASNRIIYVYTLGRYFGYSHYMSQLHPYSAAILLNKRPDKSYTGKFNDIFADLYIRVIKHIQSLRHVDSIVSVPFKPGAGDRFQPIRNRISQECSLEDLSEHFICVKNYPSQKSRSSSTIRQANIQGAFEYDGDLIGRNIVLIDDVATTGSTLGECVDVLDTHGADDIFVVVLAINQMKGIYWSANSAQVSCPKCGAQMQLMVNGQTGQFFYSCFSNQSRIGCGKSTMNFKDGVNKLIDWANSEFKT